MSETSSQKEVPKPALIVIGSVIVLSLCLAIAGSLGWIGDPSSEPPDSAPVAQGTFLFEERSDESLVVYRMPQREPIRVIPAGEENFIRGVLRSLERERRARGVTSNAPVRLTQWANGRLSLEDPTTGERTELAAFGPTNVGAFAKLLALDESTAPLDQDNTASNPSTR